MNVDIVWEGSATGTYGCWACFDVGERFGQLDEGDLGVAACGNSTGNSEGVYPEHLWIVEIDSTGSMVVQRPGSFDTSFTYNNGAGDLVRTLVNDNGASLWSPHVNDGANTHDEYGFKRKDQVWMKCHAI